MTVRSLAFNAAVAIGAATISAVCTGLATPPAYGSTVGLVSRHAVALAPHGKNRGWLSPDANRHHPWLYVDSAQNNVVLIYDLARFGIPQIGQITQGLGNPTGMAIDAAGNLYVANYYGGDVTIYPPGSTAPSVTLSQGLTTPNGLAVDTNGDLYVGNKGNPPSILVYPPGQTSPSQTITSPLIQNPGQLFFDASRNLYFQDNAGICEIPFGAQQPISLNLQGIKSYDGTVAVDPLNGNLLVSGVRNRQHSIIIFPGGDVNPARKLRTSAYADFLTIGDIKGQEYIFVPDGASNTVSIFRHDSTNATVTFQTVQYARSTAYKPADAP